jgi:hypothetical protein
VTDSSEELFLTPSYLHKGEGGFSWAQLDLAFHDKPDGARNNAVVEISQHPLLLVALQDTLPEAWG